MLIRLSLIVCFFIFFLITKINFFFFILVLISFYHLKSFFSRFLLILIIVINVVPYFNFISIEYTPIFNLIKNYKYISFSVDIDNFNLQLKSISLSLIPLIYFDKKLLLSSFKNFKSVNISQLTLTVLLLTNLLALTIYYLFFATSDYGFNQWNYGADSFYFTLVRIFTNLLTIICLTSIFFKKQFSSINLFLLSIIHFYFLFFIGVRNVALSILVFFIFYFVLNKGSLKSAFLIILLYFPISLISSYVKSFRISSDFQFSIFEILQNFFAVVVINFNVLDGISRGYIKHIGLEFFPSILYNLLPTIIFDKSNIYSGNRFFRDKFYPDIYDHGVGFSFLADSFWVFGQFGLMIFIIILIFIFRAVKRYTNIELIILFFSYTFFMMRSDLSSFLKNMFFSFIILFLFSIFSKSKKIQL